MSEQNNSNLPAAAISRWPCQHTPGPWGISGDGIIYSGSDAETAIEIGFVAQGSDGVPEAVGNGWLMANSLRLMEALKKLVAVSECSCTKFSECYRCEGLKVLKSLAQVRQEPDAAGKS